ncbi:MAG: hypothetical protein K0R55_1645 [Sporomusa sp.]|nr:hypothetical protein [Sporomusa sp.]
MYFIIAFFLVPLLSVIIYLSSYYFASSLLFHVSGILLTLLILPYIPTRIYLLGGYALAMYLYNPWYKIMYLVSFVYTCWFLVGMILDWVTSASTIGFISLKHHLHNNKRGF